MPSWWGEPKKKEFVKVEEYERLKLIQHKELLGRDREIQRLIDLVSKRESEIDQSRRDLSEAYEQYGAEVQNINQKASNEKHRIVAEFEQAQANLRREFEIISANARGERQQLVASHDASIENLKGTHAIDISHVRQTAQAREEQLIFDHEQEVRKMQNDIQQLNEALLTRDDEIYQGALFKAPDLPQKPDKKIRDEFLQVQQIVEELGRQQWRHDRLLWPEQLLANMSIQHSERLVKIAVVQDTLWSILFQFVFCSPFRVFGDAGRELEREWNDHCGEVDDSLPQATFQWPSLGIKTERWRFMTLKECRKALAQPLSQFDPRAALKEGYKDNQESLITEMTMELGKVLDLTASDVQSIQRLAKKAVRLWLDFALHRCRIRIHLAGSESMTLQEKVHMAQRNSLTLTVLPLVGRHGTVKGLELESFTRISGCGGDSMTVPGHDSTK